MAQAGLSRLPTAFRWALPWPSRFGGTLVNWRAFFSATFLTALWFSFFMGMAAAQVNAHNGQNLDILKQRARNGDGQAAYLIGWH